jgi:hypothetical protein
METSMSLQQVKKFVRDKFRTIEDCKAVLNLDTLQGLSYDQLVFIVEFFTKDLKKNERMHDWNESKKHEYLLGIGVKTNMQDHFKEILYANLDHLNIKDPDYEFYINIISYITHRIRKEK